MTVSPAFTETPESRSETTARLFAERAEAPDAGRAAIEEELVRINMPLARDLSRRFRGRGIADDDLEQVAYVGLVKAVKGFKPETGNEFTSFAVPTIRGEIRRHFRDLGWTVRPPRSIQETQQKISGCESELYQQLGRAPRPSEIAAHLGLELEQVIDALGANGCFAPASLDAPSLADADESVGQRLGELDPEFDLAEARATLAPLLAKLSRREQLIVEMRFFRGCTQAEIGAEIGVSQMHVSRLLARLVARLRAELTVAA
ncbi:SigB/SigF/SigG family RNA polymerase sigma factor [Nocardioides aquiterrae]